MTRHDRHPLGDLEARWSVPGGLRRGGAGERAAFLGWLAGAEPKQAMRLAWALGLSRDVAELDGVWDPQGAHAGRLAELLPADMSGVPDAVWAAFRDDRARGRCAFRAMGAADPGALLVHFTWNPDGLFRDGFLGTPDPDLLESTFRFRKEGPGYNFAFLADGFDAANHGLDDFYGDDAVLLRAPALVAYNHASADVEAVFWGPDADPAGFVHLTREEAGEPWRVLDADGGTLFEADTVPECSAWVRANEEALGHRMRGPRGYALRASDEHLAPDEDGPAPGP